MRIDIIVEVEMKEVIIDLIVIFTINQVKDLKARSKIIHIIEVGEEFNKEWETQNYKSINKQKEVTHHLQEEDEVAFNHLVIIMTITKI